MTMGMFQSGDVEDSMAIWRLWSRLMMQITEIKCLSSGGVGELPGPGSCRWSVFHSAPQVSPQRAQARHHCGTVVYKLISKLAGPKKQCSPLSPTNTLLPCVAAA